MRTTVLREQRMLGVLREGRVEGIGRRRRHAVGGCYCNGWYIFWGVPVCQRALDKQVEQSIRWYSGGCCPVSAVCERCAAWAAGRFGNRDLGANTYTIPWR
jgi:hypothetical protein